LVDKTMSIPDDNEQFWFNLYGLTALHFLGVTLIPMARLASIYDKKGNFCGLDYRFPGWLVFPFYILMHLAFLTPATYIFVDEANSHHSSWYDQANWLIYVVVLITILWPHVYSVDWYSLKDWKDHSASFSYRVLTNIANFLYPFMLWAATFLMIVAVAFVGLEKKWIPFALYLVYTVFLLIAAIYFTIEWWMCRRKYNKEKERGVSQENVMLLYEMGPSEPAPVGPAGGPTGAFSYGYGHGRKYR
jgi:hypothetical protein